MINCYKCCYYNTFKENERKRFSNIGRRTREAFAIECKKTLEKVSIKIISSQNTSFDFGNTDSQTRYGNTLCAFIHEVIDFIKNPVDYLRVFNF